MHEWKNVPNFIGMQPNLGLTTAASLPVRGLSRHLPNGTARQTHRQLWSSNCRCLSPRGKGVPRRRMKGSRSPVQLPYSQTALITGFPRSQSVLGGHSQHVPLSLLTQSASAAPPAYRHLPWTGEHLHVWRRVVRQSSIGHKSFVSRKFWREQKGTPWGLAITSCHFEAIMVWNRWTRSVNEWYRDGRHRSNRLRRDLRNECDRIIPL